MELVNGVLWVCLCHRMDLSDCSRMIEFTCVLCVYFRYQWVGFFIHFVCTAMMSLFFFSLHFSISFSVCFCVFSQTIIHKMISIEWAPASVLDQFQSHCSMFVKCCILFIFIIPYRTLFHSECILCMQYTHFALWHRIHTNGRKKKCTQSVNIYLFGNLPLDEMILRIPLFVVVFVVHGVCILLLNGSTRIWSNIEKAHTWRTDFRVQKKYIF